MMIETCVIHNINGYVQYLKNHSLAIYKSLDKLKLPLKMIDMNSEDGTVAVRHYMCAWVCVHARSCKSMMTLNRIFQASINS